MTALRGLLARLLDGIDRLSLAMAWLSGLTFLVLAFYVTLDTLGRSFGGPYSGFTDDISAFALAAAGTWATAYALKVGAHVRIDLLLPHLSPRLRVALDQIALTLAGLLAALLASYAWELTAGSWRLGARSISVLQAPLVIPQSLLACGLTMLAVQATALLLGRWLAR
jgi:TRAP-type mannitol/chloroaromatic compound transport system permease small subunit